MTYYERNQQFYRSFEKGNFAEAVEILEKDKKSPRKNSKLLYYLNLGTAAFMTGNYEKANLSFERAYEIGDNYSRNYFQEAASIILNPNVAPYRGEDFELLMIHYYKALSYLKTNDFEKALVECKRMNIKLLALGDKYKSEKYYRADAFVNVLMGIIYDASRDYNNAFIAYRNALNVFEEGYTEQFGVEVPEQLKVDLIRTAHLAGFPQERAQYEKQFEKLYEPIDREKGYLVFFWHNGLGPKKTEVSLDFVFTQRNGHIQFDNKNFRRHFDFNLSTDDYRSSGLSNLDVVRVVLPKYVERPAYFKEAFLEWEGQQKSLELGQNVNNLAFQSLKQRIGKELAESLLRTALKKAAEYQIRQENEGLGAAVGLFAQFTEQADTRAWQTIPHSIYYTRMALPEGEQHVDLVVKNAGSKDQHNFQFDIQARTTTFHFFHNMQVTYGRDTY